jgi:hypothetical protein
MGVFEITAPDGKVYEIEGATAQGALAALQKHLGASAPKAPAPVPTELAPSIDTMGNPILGESGAPVQASMMPLGEQMARIGGALDSGVRMAANGMTFGLADRFAGGMDALTGAAPSYGAGVDAQHAQTEAIRKANPIPAALAEGAGGLAGGLGLLKSGITLAGRVGPGLLPRVLGYGAEGAAYGAAHGAGNTYTGKASDYIENAKDGLTAGGLIGGGLPVAGAAAGALYRAAAPFVGPGVEGAGRGASAMLRAAAQADEAGVRGLSSMGPEAMLLDAGPAMKGLGQGAGASVGTGAGDGPSKMVNALINRDRATGNRITASLDETLGPSPTPSQVEAHLSGNRALIGQEYQPALQGAAQVNLRPLAEQLDAIAIAERGSGQRAARQVRDMLQDPVHARELSRDPASLLNTRQAIDGLLTTEVDPNTIRVLTQTRQAVDAELTRAVPGIKAIDAQIEESARQSAALQRGSQVLDSGKTAIRPNELANEMTQGAQPQGTLVGPSAAPMRLRQGTRSEIDRLVGTNVNDLNVLERKIGTPQDWNSQKLGTIFGEESRDRLVKILADNRQFRQTYQDIVQGSQTAQRQQSAKAMDGASGGNAPHDTTAVGLGLKAVNLVAKAISGASNNATKNEIGNILAKQGPEAQRMARALLASAQKTGENSRAIARVLSSPHWISSTSPAAGRKSSQ